MKRSFLLFSIAALLTGLFSSCNKEDPSVPVQSVNFDDTTTAVTIGGSATLNAIVLPENATNKSVSWQSLNTGIATVDEAGKVTGIATGEARIVVKTIEGEKKDTCTIKVLPEGALTGAFSVSDDGGKTVKKVYFSKGNLYNDGDKFFFESYQMDFRTYERKASCINGFISESGTPDGHWGSFGWSTPSTDYGMSTSERDSDYFGDFKDWGIGYCNCKGITPETTWRTLTINEWAYLLDTRKIDGGARYSFNITYGGLRGLVLYPDNYKGEIFNPGVPVALLPEGVVFLPTARTRSGTTVYSIIENGYWSSSKYGYEDNMAYRIFFSDTGILSKTNDIRRDGNAVRLVTE